MGERPAGGLPPSGFGPALRRNREEKGWTQRQLGEASAIHPNTIAKLERGEMEPSWQLVLALAAALGVACTAFAGGGEPEPEKPPARPGKKPRSGQAE
jgi:transcriptional regulator with XRE-family HTH domain